MNPQLATSKCLWGVLIPLIRWSLPWTMQQQKHRRREHCCHWDLNLQETFWQPCSLQIEDDCGWFLSTLCFQDLRLRNGSDHLTWTGLFWSNTASYHRYRREDTLFGDKVQEKVWRVSYEIKGASKEQEGNTRCILYTHCRYWASSWGSCYQSFQ